MSNVTPLPSPRFARSINIWLAVVIAMVAAIVVVGGLTRLTESGLSITEWKPVTGVVPPLSDADWEAELEKYRSTTQYQTINEGMSVEAFKTIYWWEWGHRLLARAIGLAALLPLLFFWRCGALTGRELRDGAILFAMVCLQGLVGWLMVVSGLVDRLEVSQYRLAAHLALAFLIFAWALHMLLRRLGVGREDGPAPGRRLAWGFLILVFAQLMLGALVAGLDAGMTYNTWPLMDGAFVPAGLFMHQPWWVNFGENVTMVQFQHRMAAYLIALVAVAVAWRALATRAGVVSGVHILGFTLVQIALGVFTLLAGAGGEQPILLGAAHQTFALVLFGAAIVHVHALSPRNIAARG